MKPLECLTRRQNDVVGLVVEGCTNQEIATKLNISSATVDTHLLEVAHRLKASNRARIAVIATKVDMGLIEQPTFKRYPSHYRLFGRKKQVSHLEKLQQRYGNAHYKR